MSVSKPKKCKICGDCTSNVFNIDFKAVSICEDCAKSICLQQVVWYTKQSFIQEDKK